MNAQYINPELLSGNSTKQQQQQLLQQQQSLDLFSFNNAELEAILAPHPDLFESELDSSLAGFDPIHFVTLDSDYGFVRDTSTLQCGPPSTITVSSESAYDSVGGHPESLYNYQETNYSLPIDFDLDFQRTMDFQRVGHNATHEYAELAAKQPTATGLLYHDSAASDYSYNGNSPASTYDDPASFGALPPSVPSIHGHGRHKSSFSDYNSDYRKQRQDIQHPSIFYDPAASQQNSAVGAIRGQTHISKPAENSRSPSSSVVDNEVDNSDPRKKYSCTSCGRFFARQYNLKTHLETHDTNRKKPFICHHPDCNRSFSRKHDLGRHLNSIHHEDKIPIGVGAVEGRKRCQQCGVSWVKGKKCDCEE